MKHISYMCRTIFLLATTSIVTVIVVLSCFLVVFFPRLYHVHIVCGNYCTMESPPTEGEIPQDIDMTTSEKVRAIVLIKLLTWLQ